MINTFQKQAAALIGPELTAVRQLINQQIQASDPLLQTALREMANHGGKFLRPSLLLLAAKVVSPGQWNDDTRQRLIKLGASIEILHMATLIHDDIIDDSPKRRGNISIQSRFGKDTAVYAGDLLFTNFFHLLIDSLNNDDYLKINASTMRKILNGELGQMTLRYQQQQSIMQYLRNANGKTAALFELAAEEGTYFAGGDHQMVQAAAQFGQNLGIAFQIIDDLLDYSDQLKLNKPVLQDLATGVYALPLLLALNQPVAAQRLKSYLSEPLTSHSERQIRQLVIDSGALDETRRIAQKFTYKAIAALQKLPANPAHELLNELAQQLLKRTY